MTGRLPTTTDVLVVGAGPTGLALSTALALSGVEVTTIDLATTVRSDSRAAGVQPRTLEDLARIGAADALITEGLQGRGFRVSTQDGPLLDIPFADLDTPYPYVLLVPQSQTEQVLRARLAEVGGRVLAAHRLVGLEQEFDAVVAQVADADGVLRSVRARYLVGCDGLHSGVRTRSGVEFVGDRRGQHYQLADVRMTEPADEPRVEFTFSPGGMLLQSALPDDQVRVVATVDEAADTLDRAGVQRIIDGRYAVQGRPEVAEVVRSSPYQVTSRLASSFSAGRVFLAGDAAHVHSPAGGQGMNTGIQDAVNLSWKLAAVLDGDDPAVLDTYDAERRPNAAALLAFTGQLTSVAEMSDPDLMGLRDDLLRAAGGVSALAPTLARKLAQLDVDYRHPHDERPEPVGRRLAPSGAWANRLAWVHVAEDAGGGESGARPGEAARTLTVRPDGYVASVA